MKKKFLVAIVVVRLLATNFSFAYLNPHYQQRHAKKKKDIERLLAGRWDPNVKKALEEFAAREGKSSPSYNPQKPPVVVLAWDNAAVLGDPGLAPFLRMVKRAEFKFSDDFWKVVPEPFGRQRIRAAYEQFASAPSDVWEREPFYHQYQKYFLQSYFDLCSSVGREACRVYLAWLWIGWNQEEARAYVKTALSEEEKGGFYQQTIQESAYDQAPLKISHGFKSIAEMKDLARLLLKSGFDVWVCDMDPQPVLEASAQDYGIDPSRVLGIKEQLSGTRFNGDVDGPFPIRSGKVADYVSHVGRTPALVVGSSSDDLDLLSYGQGLRLVLDHGDKALIDAALKNGWLIQKAFANY